MSVKEVGIWNTVGSKNIVPEGSLRGRPRPLLGPSGRTGVEPTGYLRGRPLPLFSPVAGVSGVVAVSVAACDEIIVSSPRTRKTLGNQLTGTAVIIGSGKVSNDVRVGDNEYAGARLTDQSYNVPSLRE